MTPRAQQKRADRSRRNKPHRRIDPMACITRRMPLRDDQQIDIGIAYHASLQALLTGHGTEQTWSTLACALNTALLLSEYGVCAPATQTIKLAQESLLRARERAGRTGKWALDGDGIRTLQAALNIHDEQISRTTRDKITAALHEVHKRVSMGETL